MLRSILALTILSLILATESFASDNAYSISLEAPANHCEIFVDDFAVENRYIYHGSWEVNMLTTLISRTGDNVLDAGMYVRYSEKHYNGSTETNSEKDEYISATQMGENRYEVRFAEAYQSFSIRAYRTIKSFHYYVVVKDNNGTIKRLYIKNGRDNFTSEDIDRDRYNYSSDEYRNSSRLNYLWRDSGSTIFNSRYSCIK
jgi:hypothetical protein